MKPKAISKFSNILLEALSETDLPHGISLGFKWWIHISI